MVISQAWLPSVGVPMMYYRPFRILKDVFKKYIYNIIYVYIHIITLYNNLSVFYTCTFLSQSSNIFLRETSDLFSKNHTWTSFARSEHDS